MGQAKTRGSQLERIEQAKKIKSELRPEYLVCNECSEQITDFQELDTKNLPGITVAFAGVCTCGRATFAISGDKAASADMLSSLQEQFGYGSKIGHQPIK